jgi:hypothetical protein
MRQVYISRPIPAITVLCHIYLGSIILMTGECSTIFLQLDSPKQMTCISKHSSPCSGRWTGLVWLLTFIYFTIWTVKNIKKWCEILKLVKGLYNGYLKCSHAGSEVCYDIANKSTLAIFTCEFCKAMTKTLVWKSYGKYFYFVIMELVKCWSWLTELIAMVCKTWVSPKWASTARSTHISHCWGLNMQQVSCFSWRGISNNQNTRDLCAIHLSK